MDPILCATTDLPPHTHALDTRQWRAQLGGAVGLGGGWQLQLQLPVERRVIDVEYATLDGRAYAPPYRDIHHRDEVVAGLADGSLRLGHLHRGAGPLIAVDGGMTIPLGGTQPDPFALAAAGRWHQHNQLGVGAPLVLGGAGLLWAAKPWGGAVQGGLRAPIVENGEGYRAPLTLNLGAGPSRRLWTGAVGMSAVELLREGPERWSGAQHGGRTAVQLSLALDQALGPHLSAQVDLRAPLWQHDDAHSHGQGAADEGSLRVGPLVGVGLAWTGAAPGR